MEAALLASCLRPCLAATLQAAGFPDHPRHPQRRRVCPLAGCHRWREAAGPAFNRSFAALRARAARLERDSRGRALTAGENANSGARRVVRPCLVACLSAYGSLIGAQLRVVDRAMMTWRQRPSTRLNIRLVRMASPSLALASARGPRSRSTASNTSAEDGERLIVEGSRANASFGLSMATHSKPPNGPPAPRGHARWRRDRTVPEPERVQRSRREPPMIGVSMVRANHIAFSLLTPRPHRERGP